MNIYFSGSVAGGRQKQAEYEELIAFCKTYGKVLTENVWDEVVKEDVNVYVRDTSWLDAADVLIAEISVPSLGVGMELEHAVNKKVPILCLYDMCLTKPVSKMVISCPYITSIGYATIEDAKKVIEDFLKKFNK